MNLQELLEHNEKAQAYQDSLTIDEQIELLKKHKKSVFVLHMEDGSELVRGDSESDKEEMLEFFKQYPQKGCKWIEFYK
jgi:hypothetical protein